MKGQNFLPVALCGLLFLSSMTAAVCALLFVRASGELRTLQMRANAVNNNQATARALANDAVEYGKKNPAIHPILDSIGLRQRSNP